MIDPYSSVAFFDKAWWEERKLNWPEKSKFGFVNSFFIACSDAGMGSSHLVTLHRIRTDRKWMNDIIFPTAHTGFICHSPEFSEMSGHRDSWIIYRCYWCSHRLTNIYAFLLNMPTTHTHSHWPSFINLVLKPAQIRAQKSSQVTLNVHSWPSPE